jgi:hypothetical protein
VKFCFQVEKLRFFKIGGQGEREFKENMKGNVISLEFFVNLNVSGTRIRFGVLFLK